MTRLLATLFTLLVTCATAWAEAPLCRGTDLLAALKISDPATYDKVMAKARAVPNGQSLFWKIEREGLPPSYLLGTAHVTDPRVNALPPETRTALWGAATVALELKELRSHQEVAMAGMRNARLMVMPQGQSLWDLIPDEDEAAIHGNVNLPPGTHGSLFGYQPWVVAGMLSIPLCEMERKAKGEIILDSRIAQIAGEMNTPLIGLETVEEQLSVFSAMPLDVQARYLVAVARLGPRIGDYFETLVALYEQRNVVAYMPLVLHTEEVSDDDMKIYAFVEEDLLRKRNHRMAERSANLLAQGGVFIAVGALHLPGAEGLVELIRKAGYKVTPLN